jgi:hypothetical protein
MTTGASANQVTSAMILSVAKIRIKNNTTVMVSDLSSGQAVWSDQEQVKHLGHEKSQTKACSVQQQKEGNHRRYEQCNGDKKDEQNEESYKRKCQNLDTKDQYLEERKVVPKRKTEKQ